MINKKTIIIICIFIIFTILTPIIKNETRSIERDITKYQKKINTINRSIFEAQLEYFYLSSPDVLSKKIKKYSEDNYLTLGLSQIYLNMNTFLDQQRKISQIAIDEN
jgi:hypothetical protein